MVTHQVHHLETADRIFILRNVILSILNYAISIFKVRLFKQGNVEASGTYSQLMKTHLAKLNLEETPEVIEKAPRRMSLAPAALIKKVAKEVVNNDEDLLKKQEVKLLFYYKIKICKSHRIVKYSMKKQDT
jgi:hypothetical protein